MVPVLLEETPFASTPINVKVYVSLGVIRLLGVLVMVLGAPQAGISRSVPPATKTASAKQARRDCFLLKAAKPANANAGSDSQAAYPPPIRAAVVGSVGPVVLIVSVEEASPAGRGLGLNEHTGGAVTSGVIEEHERVTPPEGMLYPLSGLTLTVPVPPLPACTLLGATGSVTVIVYCGVTASTVRGTGVADAEVVVPLIVPVAVME